MALFDVVRKEEILLSNETSPICLFFYSVPMMTLRNRIFITSPSPPISPDIPIGLPFIDENYAYFPFNNLRILRVRLDSPRNENEWISLQDHIAAPIDLCVVDSSLNKLVILSGSTFSIFAAPGRSTALSLLTRVYPTGSEIFSPLDSTVFFDPISHNIFFHVDGDGFASLSLNDLVILRHAHENATIVKILSFDQALPVFYAVYASPSGCCRNGMFSIADLTLQNDLGVQCGAIHRMSPWHTLLVQTWRTAPVAANEVQLLLTDLSWAVISQASISLRGSLHELAHSHFDSSRGQLALLFLDPDGKVSALASFNVSQTTPLPAAPLHEATFEGPATPVDMYVPAPPSPGYAMLSRGGALLVVQFDSVALTVSAKCKIAHPIFSSSSSGFTTAVIPRAAEPPLLSVFAIDELVLFSLAGSSCPLVANLTISVPSDLPPLYLPDGTIVVLSGFSITRYDPSTWSRVGQVTFPGSAPPLYLQMLHDEEHTHHVFIMYLTSDTFSLQFATVDLDPLLALRAQLACTPEIFVAYPGSDWAAFARQFQLRKNYDRSFPELIADGFFTSGDVTYQIRLLASSNGTVLSIAYLYLIPEPRYTLFSFIRDRYSPNLAFFSFYDEEVLRTPYNPVGLYHTPVREPYWMKWRGSVILQNLPHSSNVLVFGTLAAFQGNLSIDPSVPAIGVYALAPPYPWLSLSLGLGLGLGIPFTLVTFCCICCCCLNSRSCRKCGSSLCECFCEINFCLFCCCMKGHPARKCCASICSCGCACRKAKQTLTSPVPSGGSTVPPCPVCGKPCIEEGGRKHGFCSSKCSNRARSRGIPAAVWPGVGPLIRELSPTDPKYKDIAHQFLSKWLHTGRSTPTIRSISAVTVDSHIATAHRAYTEMIIKKRPGLRLRPKAGPGNTVRRFHGTGCQCTIGLGGNTSLCSASDCAICGIMRTGFRCGKPTQFSALRYGCGLYFSATSSKSAGYCKGHPTNAMFVVLVVAGQADTTTESAWGTQTAPPNGGDSVVGNPGADLNYDEIVVYTGDACLPKYLIRFD